MFHLLPNNHSAGEKLAGFGPAPQPRWFGRCLRRGEKSAEASAGGAGARAGMVEEGVGRLRRSPAGVLFAAGLAALAMGLFVHANGLIWLAGIGAAGALGIVWPWLSVRAVRVELRLAQPRGREGRPIGATLVVANRLPWRIHGMMIRDAQLGAARVTSVRSVRRDGAVRRGASRPAAAGDAPSLPATFAAGLTLIELEVMPDRFGALPRGPVRIACAFPFGLREFARPLHVTEPAVIWPETAPIGPVVDHDDGEPGVHAGRRVGIGGETCGVREFRHGDRLRLVHWAQSAKFSEPDGFDRLFVRETLADLTPRAKIGLDTRPQTYRDASSFDEAVRLAASYAEGWSRAGSQLELHIGPTASSPAGQLIAIPPSSTARAALDALAMLDFAQLDSRGASPAGVSVLVSASSAGADVRIAGRMAGGRRGVPASPDVHAPECLPMARR